MSVESVSPDLVSAISLEGLLMSPKVGLINCRAEGWWGRGL